MELEGRIEDMAARAAAARKLHDRAVMVCVAALQVHHGAQSQRSVLLPDLQCMHANPHHMWDSRACSGSKPQRCCMLPALEQGLESLQAQLDSAASVMAQKAAAAGSLVRRSSAASVVRRTSSLAASEALSRKLSGIKATANTAAGSRQHSGVVFATAHSNMLRDEAAAPAADAGSCRQSAAPEGGAATAAGASRRVSAAVSLSANGAVRHSSQVPCVHADLPNVGARSAYLPLSNGCFAGGQHRRQMRRSGEA